MPIPVNNVNVKENSLNIQHKVFTIQNIYKQVISNILTIKVKQKYCLEQHEICCFSNNVVTEQDTSSCIVINILQKETNILLERWIMSFDLINQQDIMEDDKNRFIQDINNFIHDQMPSKLDFIEMYSIAFLNNNDKNQCYTHISTQERIEFKSNAHLKAQRFHLSSLLSLEVVYDENIVLKKPTISLQSLSSPSFISWSKMEELQQPIQQQSQDVHPLAQLPANMTTIVTTNNNNNLSSNNNNNIPIIAVRRLSRLSLSAIEEDQDYNDESTEDHFMESTSNTTTIPIPSSRMQYTHHGSHRSTLAYSTSPNNNHLSTFKSIQQPSFPTSFSSSLSPNSIFDLPTSQRRNSFTNEFHHGCLVGSFEESLLSGRMSSMPSKPITFHCQIGVLGHGDCKPSLKCPPHWSIVFPAMFYKLGEEEEGSTPYVGTVDIGEHVNNVIQKSNQPGYRIPPKGQLQVVVKNPNKTAVKLFLIPYDFTDMPKNTKTFLRQKSYTIDTPQQLLRYAIHIQICRTEKKRIYLYKSMRIVFANRKADAREKFKVICEGPKEPAYMSL